MTMRLSPDFSAFVDACAEHGVRCMVVGGYALAAHGFPRNTKDLDVWVEPTVPNAERLLEALRSFGFGSLDLGVDDFAEPGHVVQLGYPPVRIDLLTSIDGVAFADAYARSAVVAVDGSQVRVISRDDLVANKRASGRLQDLADVERLLGPDAG
jgi:hypothetical protein